MTWVLVAFDDDTLAAVLDDARVRSLEGDLDFLLVTPREARWGDERSRGEQGYLTTLDDRLDALRSEQVAIAHEWVDGESLEHEIVVAARTRELDGVVIAHHNPNAAIPDPEAFDDVIRDELVVPLDVISLE